MSDNAPAPPDPPPPEIDPALAREMNDTLAASTVPASSTQGAQSAEHAAGPSIDDPELPGVPLSTRIEALLFVATEPLPLRRIKELVRTDDGRVVREAIDRLIAEHAASSRAFRIEEVAGGFQLRTRPDLAPMVARIGRKAEAEKVSPAALETLAIVAYRQPVLRADIERIRGVASGEVLRALVERGLVRVAGRAELPGSPLYYGTTTRFLEIFGLRDLADLPRDAEALRPEK